MNTETINNQDNIENQLSTEQIFTNLSGFGDIELVLKVVIGKIYMPVQNFLKITRGTIIEIGKSKNEIFDVLVNEKEIGKCDVFIESEKILAEIKQINKKKLF